jgi:hypothetical protein
MKKQKKQRWPVKLAVDVPFIEPPAKREPLRVPLGSVLLGDKSLGVTAALITGAGAVVG